MKIKETNNIESNRLLLRKFVVNDANDIYNNWTSDQQVDKYVTWNVHKEIGETEKLLNYWINDYNNDFTYRWVIVLKETQELIGCIDVIHKNVQYKTCEIGYCIGSKWWSNGYATESLKLVLDYLLNAGFEIVVAQHFSSNFASGKVMKKAGMIYEGTLHSRVINKLNERENLEVYYAEAQLNDNIN